MAEWRSALAIALAIVVPRTSAADPVDIVPTRCVEGTDTAQAEATLRTVTSARPARRMAAGTYNLDHPHAEAELLVFPKASGPALLAQRTHWEDLIVSAGGVVVRVAYEIPFVRARFPASTVLREKAEALSAQSWVESVSANSCVFPAQIIPSSEPKYPDQWALPRMRVPEAWVTEKGDKQLVVAVLDSAFDHGNPDLEPRQWLNTCEDADGNKAPDDVDGQNDPCSWEASDAPADDFRGWNFFSNDAVLEDHMNGHGTGVAGIIGADPSNGELIAGLNFDVRLMDLKIYHTSVGYSDSVLLAFAYAIGHGAHVINASWTIEGLVPALEEQIEKAGEKQIVVVAAAGNSGANLDDAWVYPCKFEQPNVICVGATTQALPEELMSSSNYSRNWVHVGAPGESIMTTSETTFGYSTLTSAAAPQASGVAALLRAYCSTASAKWIVDRLQSGPSVLGDKTKDGRRLDAKSALESGCPSFEMRMLPSRFGAWWRRVFLPKPKVVIPPRGPEPTLGPRPGPGPDPPPPAG
jgi:hypothetical protein